MSSCNKHQSRKMCRIEGITGFLSKHFLPIGTIIIIPLGIFFPTPAVYLHEKLPVVQICIVTMFSIIGMKFRLTEIQSALRCYKEIALGLIVIILLTPVIGTKLWMLPKFRELPERSALYEHQNATWNNSWSIQLPDFGPEEFRIGLQIFCTSPCASAFPTVVVTAANGNRALTLLVAVMATITSVFTVPVMTTWLIPALQSASVRFHTILLRVILFILLPLTVGRLLRFMGVVKKVVVKLNTMLKFVTSGALLVMFWMKISMVTAKGDLHKFSPWIILAVTGLGTAVISSFLVITFIFAKILGLPKKSVIAITVLSGARNSSIAITVIENLPDSVGDKDLIFFPIVFVYLSMVVIINSFGLFVTIKEEDNDVEQGVETVEANKPLTENINEDTVRSFGDREIVFMLEPEQVQSNTCESDKLTLIVNPLEQIIVQDIPANTTHET